MRDIIMYNRTLDKPSYTVLSFGVPQKIGAWGGNSVIKYSRKMLKTILAHSDMYIFFTFNIIYFVFYIPVIYI